MSDWTYAASLENERVATLLSPTTVEVIAHRVAAEMEILCCHLDPCRDHADFGRVIYCLRVSKNLFDVFFNSPYGYRGAYFRSSGEGLDANAVFIAAISPRPLEYSGRGATDEELTWIRESLHALSAKAWLAENGLHLCPKCEGEWGNKSDANPEIFNGRWETAEPGSLCIGRKAPRLTKIRVFGAFVDDRKNEFIPSRKRHRAYEIHEQGWS